jgi:hypothetical protein
MPFAPDAGVARERTFSVPQLVRAAYGDAFAPSLLAPQPVVRVACPARRRRPTPGLGPRLRTPERRLSSLSRLEARRGLHGPRQPSSLGRGCSALPPPRYSSAGRGTGCTPPFITTRTTGASTARTRRARRGGRARASRPSRAALATSVQRAARSAAGGEGPPTLSGGGRPTVLPGPSEGSGLAHAPRSATVSRVEARRALRSPPRARPQR